MANWEEEDEEIKGHIKSFIEAFKVPRNKQKRVKEILYNGHRYST